MVGDYYPFGLTMAGISSKALSFGEPENKYKYNEGTELNNDFGLSWYETMNRSYDPQIGRFLQIDEFGEIAEEWSPYVFGNNNPILFNDPLGLFTEDPNKPKETSTAENPTELSNVTVIGAKGLWGKTRLYYQMMDYTGGNLGRIVNDRLRADMVNIDGIVKFRERVNEMTRAQDKVTLEVASWFIPTGAILKVFKFKKVLALFKLKRGKAAVNATEEIAEQVVAHGDEAVKTGENVVYHSVEDGVTQYVGITNNLARRGAEHLAQKGISIKPLMQGLSRSDARAVEQVLIEIHGLGKNGGTLLNKINSIATSNPTYSAQIQRGYELLKSIGYQ